MPPPSTVVYRFVFYFPLSLSIELEVLLFRLRRHRGPLLRRRRAPPGSAPLRSSAGYPVGLLLCPHRQQLEVLHWCSPAGNAPCPIPRSTPLPTTPPRSPSTARCQRAISSSRGGQPEMARRPALPARSRRAPSSWSLAPPPLALPLRSCRRRSLRCRARPATAWELGEIGRRADKWGATSQ
jgi:hypothetical protein